MARKNENVKGYQKPEIIEKFMNEFRKAVEAVKAGNETEVRISHGNSKMGEVASVSTLPYLTCPARCEGTCGVKCYAAKIANLYSNVRYSYAVNTALAMYKPEIYWSGIDMAVKAVRFFRFHVSGDIMNADYFANMVKIAINNPHTEILCFTKRYEIVNSWVDENGEIPSNLHILFSGWNNLETINPHDMPETNVFKTEDEIKENWKICGGNCFNCACRGVGCWQAKTGDTIAFKLH